MKIITEKVDLGVTKVKIPVANLNGKNPGPKILITAGMDGDEYTGIQAAYKLIEYFSETNFPGELNIIPIVNTPGFFAGKSLNPLDNKYPKYVYPGNSFGSPTLRLIHWLNKNYLAGADLWLDLHSGSSTENLNPFVWGFETGNNLVNDKTKNILANLKSPVKVYTKRVRFSREDKLASKKIGYLVFESGEMGQQNKVDIERMVSWVKAALNTTWNPKPKNDFQYFEKVSYYNAKKPGLWKRYNFSKNVKKGEIFGVVKSIEGKKIQEVKIKESGIILWAKSTLFVNSGDELVAQASWLND